MKELNNSQKTSYIQALKNPSLLSEEALLQLIVLYPYSQPLIFAYELRKMQLAEESTNKSLALLYSPSSSWLWTYLTNCLNNRNTESRVVNISLIVEKQHEDEVIPVTIEATENSSSEKKIVEENQMSSIINEENDELDRLVNQGSVLADYFIFDSKEDDVPILEVVVEDSRLIEEPEDVSLYNDDLMPYSFRWWLHKTRLEHADSYQPFAITPTKKSDSSIVNFKKLDEAILDQQIKEHIIHFQDPEAKLSEQVKNRPIEPVQPKRTDTIIDRFIREEPIIQAPSADSLNNENMARQSAEDNYVLVTETLANVYKDQGLFQKAIEVFNKLILKYPEKKSYFASRIQELEKNI